MKGPIKPDRHPVRGRVDRSVHEDGSVRQGGLIIQVPPSVLRQLFFVRDSNGGATVVETVVGDDAEAVTYNEDDDEEEGK